MKKKFIYVFIFLTLILISDNVFAKALKYTSCGYGVNQVKGIPVDIPKLTALGVTFLQIAIPIVLIISGVIDMTKATASGNSEAINKNKTRLIKKFLSALFAFLVVAFTTNIIKLVANSSEKGVFVACMSCYLNNDCNESYFEDYRPQDSENDDEGENGGNGGGSSSGYRICEEMGANSCASGYDYLGRKCTYNGLKCTAILNCEDIAVKSYCENSKQSSGVSCIWINDKCKAYAECGEYGIEDCQNKTDYRGNKCTWIKDSNTGRNGCYPVN